MAAGRRTSLPRPGLLACCLLVTILVVSPSTAPAASSSLSGQLSSTWQTLDTCWALGVAVSNGAGLEGGGRLSWAQATNLTLLVQLPNITRPDGITYVELSAMSNGNQVLQLAAGIWPNNTWWSAYSWVITKVDTNSPSYDWVLNSSAPRMYSHDLISLSMGVFSPSEWSLAISDLDTGASLRRTVSSEAPVSFATGDQEVFAFESYTRNPSTFMNMGNLTLDSVIVDGWKVVNGLYSYAQWDAVHHPLFVVGISSPPPYISAKLSGNGGAFMSYDSPWTVGPPILSIQTGNAGYVLLACLVPLTFMIDQLRRWARSSRRGG